MRFVYRKTHSLNSKPKDQRSIIADILLQTDKPLNFAEIVAEARKARYEETLKRGKQNVTVEESIKWHLDRMMKARTVKQEAI